MTERPPADQDLALIAERLSDLKRALGAEYWQNGDVQDLQGQLRRLLGQYNAWSEDGLPMHQRARAAARLERSFARLLWPGHDDS